jgi:predicted enzyme related to lactoylglutathione lyase
MSKGPQWTFGRFVWHELSTPDMARSQAFYSELLGWKYQSFPGGADPYQLILVDGAPRGGLVAGDTTQLMAYASVPDVDRATAAALAGGGTVLVHPVEVPGVGRLAVLADAGGAVFSILRNAGGDAPHPGPARPGLFAWHQLECPPDAADAAVGFYAAVLGWTISAAAVTGPVVFRAGDRPSAGLAPSPAAVGSRWLACLAVDDLPAARQRAVRLGGEVLAAELPAGDRPAALVADSLGTVFGLRAI